VPNNNRRDGLEQYGRLQRKKIEVPRDSPMQVALKVFDLFGASSSILDIHFQGEVGTGLGPTLEFFASVSKEFAWKDLKLWRDADSTLPSKYVHHPFGLFPSPMLNEVVDGPKATERDRYLVFSHKPADLIEEQEKDKVIPPAWSIYRKITLRFSYYRCCFEQNIRQVGSGRACSSQHH
jgi:hypothetical protein